MNDSDLDNFNREYNDYRNKVDFERNYEIFNNMRRGGNRRLRNGNNRNAPLAFPSGNNYNNMRSSYNDNYEEKKWIKKKRK